MEERKRIGEGQMGGCNEEREEGRREGGNEGREGGKERGTEREM